MVELGELFRTLGPTLVALAPHVKKAALYMFVQRDASGEYGERFRELLAYTREDVRGLWRAVHEVRYLCEEFGINTQESGSLNRIDARLNWYLGLRQARVLKRIQNLADELRSSIAGITNVIACFNGLTAGSDEPVDYVESPEYEGDESVQELSSVEGELQTLLANPEADIDSFVALALRFLNNCDRVLAEFTEGIEVGPSR
jgi:hypothetical protein